MCTDAVIIIVHVVLAAGGIADALLRGAPRCGCQYLSLFRRRYRQCIGTRSSIPLPLACIPPTLVQAASANPATAESILIKLDPGNYVLRLEFFGMMPYGVPLGS